MADVSFNEEPQYAVASVPQKQSLLIRLVFATGLAKTEQGALQVLLVTAVAAAVLAIGIFALGVFGKEDEYVAPLPPPPPPHAYR